MFEVSEVAFLSGERFRGGLKGRLIGEGILGIGFDAALGETGAGGGARAGGSGGEAGVSDAVLGAWVRKPGDEVMETLGESRLGEVGL